MPFKYNPFTDTFDYYVDTTEAIFASAVIADNAVVRGDGGARNVQDSGVIIDDSDNVSDVNVITVTRLLAGGVVKI